MAVTKTNFINYLRCPRYVALDKIKHDKLDAYMSFEEYEEEELKYKINEILENMYDEDDEDLIEVKDEQLEVMLPYYNKIEILAGKLCKNYFNGTFKYSAYTNMQESFDCKINGIRYLCYVDIYNEDNDKINIIEVKATTSKKFLELGEKIDGEITSIFRQNDVGIYEILEDITDNIEDIMPLKKYENARMKLLDRKSSVGKYVYDLAVQRYIIEHDLIEHNSKYKKNDIKYYLAVINADYVYDCTIENNELVYNTDENFNEIITYFDLTTITSYLQAVIDIDRKKVELYLNNMNLNSCSLSIECERKKRTKCKFVPICYKHIPDTNSLFNFIDNHHGFKTIDNEKHNTYDLVNDGIIKMIDLDDKYINRPKNLVQKRAVLNDKPYIKLDKIKAGCQAITYPIYHLDFETFPCPLPRYKGEKPYTQSVFQFSIHVEKEEYKCDKEIDHYEYLAKDHTDNREQLIKEMIKHIDTTTNGTVLVYNEGFEKARLKELAKIFPEYSIELNKIRDMVFDLMHVIKGNTKLYETLGFDKDEVGFNYYHQSMSGSFSIKKILPIFSDLTYKGMEIGNGVEALVTYAKFNKMTKEEYKHKYQKLVEYCKQDTWAMVKILWGLKEFVNNSKDE